MPGKNYFEDLDGLRFLAFLSVFCAHAFYSEDPIIQENHVYHGFRFYGHLGIFGVNFFFVLSGYLITWLLLKEYTKKGSINLIYFYTRRVLRIWPLYYAVVFIGFAFVPFIQQHIFSVDYEESAPLWPFLVFLNNFFGEPQSAILGVLWSIAVEEQFYLVWPILLLIFERRLPLLFLIIIFGSSLLRTFVIGYGYTNTFSCISDLALGSGLAYFTLNSDRFLKFFVDLPKGTILLAYIMGISLFLFRPMWSNIPFIYNNERILFSLFFGFVIMEQNFSRKSLFKMSSFPILTYWGQRSYGLYLLHFISIYAVSKVFELVGPDSLLQTLLIRPLIFLIISLFLAESSYRFFESYFLRLKTKFRWQ